MRKNVLSTGVILFIMTLFIVSCQKQKEVDNPATEQQAGEAGSAHQNNLHGHLIQTNKYPSDVVLKWMNMQLRLMQTSAPFIGGLPAFRPIAYSGIALYESVMPGMPAYQTLSGQLTDMPAMPQTLPGYAYHWPSCANAVMADMNRKFFANTSTANKYSMDSLENALNTEYEDEVITATFERSVQFAKAIAQ